MNRNPQTDETVASQSIAGIPIGPDSLKSATERVCRYAAEGKAKSFHLVNAYSVVCAHEDENHFAALTGPQAWCLPDGRPLRWLSLIRRDGPPIRHVRGADLFRAVLDRGREFGIRHYFLGTTDETLNALQRQIMEQYPGIIIAGASSPPFRRLSDHELRAQDASIRATDADIVWVALGTPKQDIEGQRITQALGVTTVAVGAAFNFVAGDQPEAPAWTRSLGMEWAFRLAQEPRRLWRRYLLGNLKFLRISALGRSPNRSMGTRT